MKIGADLSRSLADLVGNPIQQRGGVVCRLNPPSRADEIEDSRSLVLGILDCQGAVGANGMKSANRLSVGDKQTESGNCEHG